MDIIQAIEIMGYNCSTRNGQITEWFEVFEQPSNSEIISLAETKQLENYYHVTPEDFYLNIEEADQNAFSRLITLLEIRGTLLTDYVEIADYLGIKHIVTYLRLREILAAYGVYCYNRWSNSN